MLSYMFYIWYIYFFNKNEFGFRKNFVNNNQ